MIKIMMMIIIIIIIVIIETRSITSHITCNTRNVIYMV